jgi:hypothetical protein
MKARKKKKPESLKTNIINGMKIIHFKDTKRCNIAAMQQLGHNKVTRNLMLLNLKKKNKKKQYRTIVDVVLSNGLYGEVVVYKCLLSVAVQKRLFSYYCKKYGVGVDFIIRVEESK